MSNEVKKMSMKDMLVKSFQAEGSDLTEQQIVGYMNEAKALGVATQLDIFQFYSFIKICKKLNLNPLLKQIYAYPANGANGPQIVTVISYLQYLKAAEKHPKYQLPELTLVEKDENGKPLPLDDVYYIARVKRKGEETTLEKKFIMKEWSKNTAMWKKQPIHMLFVRTLKNILATAYPDAICDFEQLEFQNDVEPDRVPAKKKPIVLEPKQISIEDANELSVNEETGEVNE